MKLFQSKSRKKIAIALLIFMLLFGGCHAYFGMYGKQEGDGMPEISNTEQINTTTEAIMEMTN